MGVGWTARTTAALMLAAAVLGGCSNEQPANDTLPEPSAGTSTSSEALPPLGPADFPMPDEARTQDASGAATFVRYYISLINRTSTVMDADPLRSLSAGCADCSRIATDTENDARAGYHYRGGELTITWIEAGSINPTTEVAFFADQAALTVVDASGQPVPKLTFQPLSQMSCGATLQWDAGRTSWVITGLTLG